MGVVVLRNVLERRSEWAILRALGFAAGPVYGLLFVEYGALLTAGLGIGALAAAASILPTFWTTQTQVAAGLQAGMLALIVTTSGACTSLAILAGLRKNDPAALREE